MPLPEGRVPLSDEQIAKLLKLCEESEYINKMIRDILERKDK